MIFNPTKDQNEWLDKYRGERSRQGFLKIIISEAMDLKTTSNNYPDLEGMHETKNDIKDCTFNKQN